MDSDSPISPLSELEKRWNRAFSFGKGVANGSWDFSPEDRQILKEHKGTETLYYKDGPQYLEMMRRFCDGSYNLCLCLEKPGHYHSHHDIPCPCLLNPSIRASIIPEKEVERCIKEVNRWLVGPMVTPFEEEKPKIGRLKLKKKTTRKPATEKPHDKWAGLFIRKK